MDQTNSEISAFSLKRIDHEANEEIPLKIGKIQVGRDLTSDIYVNSEYCSRRHCILDVRKYIVWLIDKSTCGTYVNDIKYRHVTQILSENDKIGFGFPTNMTFLSSNKENKFIYQFVRRSTDPMEVHNYVDESFDKFDGSLFNGNCRNTAYWPEANALRMEALDPKAMRILNKRKEIFDTVQSVKKVMTVKDEKIIEKCEFFSIKSILKKESTTADTPIHKKQVAFNESQSTTFYYEKEFEEHEQSDESFDDLPLIDSKMSCVIQRNFLFRE